MQLRIFDFALFMMKTYHLLPSSEEIHYCYKVLQNRISYCTKSLRIIAQVENDSVSLSCFNESVNKKLCSFHYFLMKVKCIREIYFRGIDLFLGAMNFRVTVA